MTNGLDFTDKRIIITKAAISAIPYIGGTLATLYSDFKTEKRIKNLEVFYQDISAKLSKLTESNIHINSNTESELVLLIEKVNEQVENEFRKSKISYLQNYLIRILTSPSDTKSFDKDLYFIETLGSLSELECEILLALRPYKGLIPVVEINKPNIDQFIIFGSIGRLKLLGLVSTITTNFIFNGSLDNVSNESVILTDLGKAFIHFCLEENL